MRNAARALLVCLVLGQSALAAEAELTGRQVMEKCRSANDPADELLELEMQLVAEGGRVRRRRLRIEYLKAEDGLDRTLVRFSYPRRMKGTGLLTLEQKARSDDQWLYLPSLRKVRRIASDAKAERFVQSDFTYEDLQPEDLDDNAYKMLRTETVDGRRCYVVEAVAKSKSAYARREIAVDSERWLPIRTLHYDADGKLVKTRLASKVQQHKGRFWRPDRTEMIDHVREHKTVLLVKSRSINGGIDAGHFTQRFLKSGR